jgi:hypothetical protein
MGAWMDVNARGLSHHRKPLGAAYTPQMMRWSGGLPLTAQLIPKLLCTRCLALTSVQMWAAEPQAHHRHLLLPYCTKSHLVSILRARLSLMAASRFVSACSSV